MKLPKKPRNPRVKVCGKVIEVTPAELEKIKLIDQKWMGDMRKKQFRDSIK